MNNIIAIIEPLNITEEDSNEETRNWDEYIKVHAEPLHHEMKLREEGKRDGYGQCKEDILRLIPEHMIGLRYQVLTLKP